MDGLGKIQKIAVLKKGDYFFKQNDDSRDLFIIKSGRARIYKVEGGIEVELDVIGPGGIVGEIAVIDGGLRSASVIALESTEAFMISAEEFKTLSQKIPDWFQKIAVILAQRLREVDGKIDRNMANDETPHVAAAISLISYSSLCKTLEDGSYEVHLKMLENEVVDMLNIKCTEVTDAIESLHKQDAIKISKGKVLISSRKKLDECAKTIFTASSSLPQI